MWFAHAANQPCPATVSLCSCLSVFACAREGLSKGSTIFNYHCTAAYNHQPISRHTKTQKMQKSFKPCRVEDAFKWVSTPVTRWEQNSNKPNQCWYSFRAWSTLNTDWWDCSDPGLRPMFALLLMLNWVTCTEALYNINNRPILTTVTFSCCSYERVLPNTHTQCLLIITVFAAFESSFLYTNLKSWLQNTETTKML